MTQSTILLVEDNADDVALTQRAFRKRNVATQLVVAKDGVEALDYLFGTGTHAGRDVSLQPSLILLDLKLPKVDGLEVLRRLRNDPRTNLVRVVVLTSSNEETDIDTSYRLGANSYIRKPVDFENFLEVTGQLGLYWLTLNVPPPMTRAIAA